MKFEMIRNSLLITKAQISKKRNDQRIKHYDHYDYTYLTDIPSNGDIDEAFDCFATKVLKEHFKTMSSDDYSIGNYFSEVQLLLDDKTQFWTIKFRFDNYRLEEEYEIDTGSV